MEKNQIIKNKYFYFELAKGSLKQKFFSLIKKLILCKKLIHFEGTDLIAFRTKKRKLIFYEKFTKMKNEFEYSFIFLIVDFVAAV